MKVLLVNGSPHKDGTTHRALREVAGNSVSGAENNVDSWLSGLGYKK